ncbi:hypothetical protein HPB48_009245 [Haemaphysalis longicornis]|uniref:Uncharacterized protein n=1 Tax=Haemaphysalis longicornis TaxID=44386 RepID=A0A9J6GXH1_HAELO|nr:hypothetical protein HPB48_009245 [Haemaphysalis longicornis]
MPRSVDPHSIATQARPARQPPRTSHPQEADQPTPPLQHQETRPASPGAVRTVRNVPGTRLIRCSLPPHLRRALAPAAMAHPSDRVQDVVVLLSSTLSSTPSPTVSTSPPPGPGNNELHPSSASSPENRFRSVDVRTPRDEEFCVKVWVLCAVVTFPLVISSWLFMVPWLVGLTRRPPTGDMVSTPPWNNSAATMSSGLTSAAPWGNFSAYCIIPKVLEEPPQQLSPAAAFKLQVSTPRRPAIFCMFRITSVVNIRRVHGNFMFDALPFDLCPNIVYWSMGITNGSLHSRLPRFDEVYGITQLRNITDRLNFPNIRILVALGGFPEDGPHFVRLEQEPAILDKLKNNLLRAQKEYRLDGFFIEEPTAYHICSRGNRARAVELLLQGIRNVFNAHNLTKIVLALSVEPEAVNARFIATRYAPHVDYIFIKTRKYFLPDESDEANFCKNTTDSIRQAIQPFANRIDRRKLCTTEHLEIPSVLSDRDPFRLRYFRVRKSKAYFSTFHRVCDRPGFCFDGQLNSSCLVHRFRLNYTTPVGQYSTSLMISSAAELLKRADLNFYYPSQTQTSQPPAESCILVEGLSADKFADQCHTIYERYLLLIHLINSTETPHGPAPRGYVKNSARLC